MSTRLWTMLLADCFACGLWEPSLPYSYLPPQEYPPRITLHSRFHSLLTCVLYCFSLSCFLSASLAKTRFTLAITAYGHTACSHVLSFSLVGPYVGFDLYSHTFYACTSLGFFERHRPEDQVALLVTPAVLRHGRRFELMSA